MGNTALVFPNCAILCVFFYFSLNKFLGGFKKTLTKPVNEDIVKPTTLQCKVVGLTLTILHNKVEGEGVENGNKKPAA